MNLTKVSDIESALLNEIASLKELLKLARRRDAIQAELDSLANNELRAFEFVLYSSSSFFGIPTGLLVGPSRPAHIARARQVAMTLSYELCEQASTTSVGKFFGGRDHGTVIHAIKTVKALCDTEPRFRKQVEQLREQIKEQIEERERNAAQKAA